MSSTSSSECESDEYWQYEHEYDKSYRKAYGQNPFYPTMGQPLICYAQVPQPVSLKRRGRKRQRDSPNCFVKAFRWYTEERVPNRNMSSNKPDITAFAAWLDAKYDEFLHECTMTSDVFRVTVNQTSVIEAERTSKIAYCEPCPQKRFLRMKSPWKRKRRAKSNETGDLHEKSNQSFQYILQPKDMSLAPSEYCNPCSRVTASECVKKGSSVRSRSFSNITVVINNDEARDPTVQKEIEEKATGDFTCQYCEAKPPRVDAGTQYNVPDSALTLGGASTSPYLSEKVDECLCPLPNKKLMPVNKVDNVIICERREPTIECPCDGDHQSLDRIPRKGISRGASENISKDIQVKIVPNEDENNSCQCPEKKLGRIDVQSQHEDTCPVQTSRNTCCECGLREHVQSYPSPVQSTSKVHQCPCERKAEDERVNEKIIVAVQLSQNTAQTSSHSIHLEKEFVNVYPLFMKIICADKLNDENDK